MFSKIPIEKSGFQVSLFECFQAFIGANVRQRSEGIGGGFPADCVTLHNICQHCLHRIQLFISSALCPSSFSSLSPPNPPSIVIIRHSVRSAWLGDNSWIICMPAPPMVIHHGLQALSTAFLCEMHHTEYLLRSHGRQDKTPNIQKLAYPSVGPWPPIYRQSQDWDRWKIKEMQFSNTCVEGTTICIFRALHHDLWSRAAFNAAFYEFRLWRTLAVPLKHSFCVLCAMSWTGR